MIVTVSPSTRCSTASRTRCRFHRGRRARERSAMARTRRRRHCASTRYDASRAGKPQPPATSCVRAAQRVDTPREQPLGVDAAGERNGLGGASRAGVARVAPMASWRSSRRSKYATSLSGRQSPGGIPSDLEALAPADLLEAFSERVARHIGKRLERGCDVELEGRAATTPRPVGPTRGATSASGRRPPTRTRPSADRAVTAATQRNSATMASLARRLARFGVNGRRPKL